MITFLNSLVSNVAFDRMPVTMYKLSGVLPLSHCGSILTTGHWQKSSSRLPEVKGSMINDRLSPSASKKGMSTEARKSIADDDYKSPETVQPSAEQIKPKL